MRAAFAGLVVVLSSCAGPVAQGPPELHLGIDICDGCGMAISDARYAAASASRADGERRVLRFDDIGCLARWQAQGSDPQPEELWVRDRHSEVWVAVSGAVFLRSGDWDTPMGSGLAAFADPGRSSSHEAMRWDAVVLLARRGELDRPLEAR
jgi:copper chaperone NosL